MAVDGTYKLEIQTPMGVQTALLTATSDGGTLNGTITGPTGVQQIENGSVSGDTIAFSTKITTPMGEMTLGFQGTVTGDDIAGQVQTGSFGSSPFKGSRS